MRDSTAKRYLPETCVPIKEADIESQARTGEVDEYRGLHRHHASGSAGRAAGDRRSSRKQRAVGGSRRQSSQRPDADCGSADDCGLGDHVGVGRTLARRSSNADAAPAVARNAAGNAETHRALLHTTFGVSLCEQFFGDLYKRSSDGGTVATRTVAEVHILEDMKAILTPSRLSARDADSQLDERAERPPEARRAIASDSGDARAGDSESRGGRAMSAKVAIIPGVSTHREDLDAEFERGSLAVLARGFRDVLWRHVELFENMTAIVVWVGGDRRRACGNNSKWRWARRAGSLLVLMFPTLC